MNATPTQRLLTMESRAIVIMYHGDEASQYVLTHIIESLIGSGIVNKCVSPQIFQLSSDDLAKASAVITEVKPEQEDTPENLAAIFIGERFKAPLQEKNTSKFAVDITADILQGNERTKNAVEILVNPNTPISKDLVVKYKLTPAALTVIRNAYSYV